MEMRDVRGREAAREGRREGAERPSGLDRESRAHIRIPYTVYTRWWWAGRGGRGSDLDSDGPEPLATVGQLSSPHFATFSSLHYATRATLQTATFYSTFVSRYLRVHGGIFIATSARLVYSSWHLSTEIRRQSYTERPSTCWHEKHIQRLALYEEPRDLSPTTI